MWGWASHVRHFVYTVNVLTNPVVEWQMTNVTAGLENVSPGAFEAVSVSIVGSKKDFRAFRRRCHLVRGWRTIGGIWRTL